VKVYCKNCRWYKRCAINRGTQYRLIGEEYKKEGIGSYIDTMHVNYRVENDFCLRREYEEEENTSDSVEETIHIYTRLDSIYKFNKENKCNYFEKPQKRGWRWRFVS